LHAQAGASNPFRGTGVTLEAMSLDVSLAIDGGAAAEALAPHLPGLERCTPRYVKYKPGHNCQVLYDLVVDGTCAAGHLTMLRPRRAERLWSRVVESRLPERAGVPACHVGELAAVLQLYPVDLRLPGLVEAAAGAELVRYKPGRRAVLRYRRGERVVYGKLRADDAGRSHMAVARSLIAAGVATPTPLEYRPALRMTVHAEAPGGRLAEKRGADLEVWMEPVADALARLQATSIADLPAFSVERELEDLRAAAETAAALLPELRGAIDRLAARLIADFTDVRPRARVIHGSFHDDQVLVGPAGVILLDLDSVAVGDPLLDVGHFASYLGAAGQHGARSRFLDACTPGPEALLFEAAALVRWSSLPFRTLEPDWPAAVEQRLKLADRCLTAYRRRSLTTAS
jgi:Phosphotransferase enzyme family